MTDPANAAKAATWCPLPGGVSLGGTDAEGKTISRQITNLAAGSEDSDAVNVAQLKALASQGMNFQGNDTNTSVHLDQGGTLQIQGSGRKENTEYSTQNIKVLTDTANNRLPFLWTRIQCLIPSLPVRKGLPLTEPGRLPQDRRSGQQQYQQGHHHHCRLC